MKIKAIDSKRTSLNKIKEWANSQRFGYSEVKNIQGEINIVYVNVSPSEKMVFVLDAGESYKTSRGHYVELTDSELEFMDILNYELSEDHIAETGQDISDWV